MMMLAAILGVALLIVGILTAARAALFGSGDIADYRYHSDPARLALGVVLMILGAVLLVWAAN